MFGQTAADAVVRVRSSRQIQDVSASLEQLGWIVSAPNQGLQFVEMTLLNKTQLTTLEYNSTPLSFQAMALWESELST